METIGICIKFNVRGQEQKKFVGKLSYWQGRTVFYRSARFSDVYSTATKAYSIDSRVWDEAAGRGAKGMLLWLTDKKQLLWFAKASIERSPAVSLGEFAQYRIDPSAGTVERGYNNPPNIPYTALEIVIDHGEMGKGNLQPQADRPRAVFPTTPAPPDVEEETPIQGTLSLF